MNELPTPQIGRRQLLRTGGLALSLGALAAACGSGRSGSSAPGRIGVAQPPATLPAAEIDDVALLRTAQSLEHTLLEVLAAATASGALSAAEQALAERFVADHTEHSAQLGTLITARDGEEFACANPFLMDRAVAPFTAALESSDDVHRDVVNAVHAFESIAGASYQALVGSVTDAALRREAMLIGGEEHRHAAALAAVVNPDTLLSPVMSGEQPGVDDAGIELMYAIPSTFGPLTGIELVVGAPDDEGSRVSVMLQTPAENTIVYAHLSC